MGLISEAIDRRVLAKAGDVSAARSGEARKQGLIDLGKLIYEFVQAVEGECGNASGADLAALIQRHYLVRAGVFKAIGIMPPSLHEQGLGLAKRLSEVELGLRPGGTPAAGKAARRAKASRKAAKKKPVARKGARKPKPKRKKGRR